MQKQVAVALPVAVAVDLDVGEPPLSAASFVGRIVCASFVTFLPPAVLSKSVQARVYISVREIIIMLQLGGE